MKTDAQTKFQEAYAATSQPIEKRDLVIKAIDDEIISRGKIKLSDMKRLFSGKLVDIRVHPENKTITASVYFEPVYPPPATQPGQPAMSSILKGWYLRLLFLSYEDNLDGVLVNYSLSNVHKPPAPMSLQVSP